MKISLYAKKINRGHVHIGDVQVSDNFGYQYRLQVRQELSVRIASNNEITSSSPITTERIFEYKPSLMDRGFKDNRKYFEI